MDKKFFIMSYVDYPQMNFINDSELSHHGIKGQHWGERNGPPYPIDHKVMKKGTKLNSVIAVTGDKYQMNAGKLVRDANGNIQKVPIYTYNPDDKWDNQIYKGPFSRYIENRAQRRAPFANVKIQELKFETIKDLTMPTKEERVNEFKNLYNDKKSKKDIIKDCSDIQKLLVQQQVGNPKEIESYKKLNLKKLKTDADYKTAYEIFNHAMEAAFYYKSTSKYLDNISKKYDAMVDDNNQGIYNNAHDPVIIFNINESLKNIGSKHITDKEISKNISDLREGLHKLGIESVKF